MLGVDEMIQGIARIVIEKERLRVHVLDFHLALDNFFHWRPSRINIYRGREDINTREAVLIYV